MEVYGELINVGSVIGKLIIYSTESLKEFSTPSIVIEMSKAEKQLDIITEAVALNEQKATKDQLKLISGLILYLACMDQILSNRKGYNIQALKKQYGVKSV